MVIDYTEHFLPHPLFDNFTTLKAQGKKDNVLILKKLDKSIKRVDGKMARYSLENRWLSTECENTEDEAYVCVQGSDFTYWQSKEIKEILSNLKTTDLFEHFLLL